MPSHAVLAAHRDGTFEARLIGKHERRFTGFDDKIFVLSSGMTVRENQGFLAEVSAVEVSSDLISTVTGAVAAEETTRQSPPVEPRDPVVFFDALRVMSRNAGDGYGLCVKHFEAPWVPDPHTWPYSSI